MLDGERRIFVNHVNTNILTLVINLFFKPKFQAGRTPEQAAKNEGLPKMEAFLQVSAKRGSEVERLSNTELAVTEKKKPMLFFAVDCKGLCIG